MTPSCPRAWTTTSVRWTSMTTNDSWKTTGSMDHRRMTPMSNYIPLVEYKGVQIQVDTEVGKFMCYLDDHTMVEERTLSTVRKRIDNAEPVAKVMLVSTEHW